jgi:hypothetical protein
MEATFEKTSLPPSGLLDRNNFQLARHPEMTLSFNGSSCLLALPSRKIGHGGIRHQSFAC